MENGKNNYPALYRNTLFPFFRRKVQSLTGTENLPSQGPYIIVANHIGSIDPPTIVSALHPFVQQTMYFVTEQYMVNILGLRRAITKLGMIPKIENKKSSCLEVAREYLEKGLIVGIFPEGMRNNGPILMRGKTGAARLALWTKAPVIPVGYRGPGTWSVRQGMKNLFIKTDVPISINIGKPMHFANYYGTEITYERLRAVTSQIMRALAELSGKLYPY